jgi:site-specific DNA-methyltransferase (cytosine-N4-specific)
VRYISRPSDLVMDCFSGVGTTGVVCLNENRNYLGIENNPEYHKIAEKRLSSI